ncbi:uroporphyrinogen-III synthase [Chelatococcus sambhunathii]|uniref:Uroporphyrinogen-III synthase n=1 Tax=Chelatococcus sambhunathii TaxID=363953 RepID=A0ABU1DH00_9HYPH|nr:uroporphyrinogen-III synthase [Chelatococcus sambhunathii]MDR4307397.1 uroporphyrinogen-III synthase [Chelatococcus sambhunathii]
MRVLVLRPERAARRTADALRGLGHTPVLAPVLAITDLSNPIPDGPFDAVLATSANGLRKLAVRREIERLRSAPLIAVGDRTAEAGCEAGFVAVHVAEGDGRALVAEALRLFPSPARFLHAAGADRAFDLAGALSFHGHRVDLVELYKAEAAATLPPAIAEALAAPEDLAVLHHSGRIAETFLALVDGAGLGEVARAVPHAALAERIARALRDAGCRRVETAERPDEQALLKTLDRLDANGSPSAFRRTK